MFSFKLKEKGTTVKTELMAGLTTFLAISYIIFVNPDILSQTGMDKGALITVTCLSAFIGTILVGLWTNSPLAMAPGMGLNAFFTYTLVMGMDVTWNVALGVVFISGIAFLILTLTGFREKIVEAIPLELRLAIPAGIGLFIAFIGMQNLGLIVGNEATLVGLGEMTPTVLLGLLGLIVIGILEVKKVKGAIIIGIIFITMLGMVLGYVELPSEIVSMPPSIKPIAFKLDIMGALKVAMIGPIFSFMFVDLFDSVATIIACAKEADMVDEDGKIEGINKILTADAVASVAGSVLGTSTTTTVLEAATGITAGGRTGLTAVTTASLFLVAMFFTPIISIIPAFAIAPALIIVGVYMFKSLIEIKLDNIEIGIPVFLTVSLMPLTYSISTGITFGFLSFGLIQLILGKSKNIKPALWLIIILSAVELLLV